ncbi:MAG: U32 family peptidase, partial [Kiritimatiellae bacterium]|nr:U32 family peptidase [Kiritimatiellia bacterium]
MNQAELLSPAGDFETALAAFDAGADAVYCGLPDFSARAFAKNFDFTSLSSLVRLARKRGKKVYVTFNTVLDEDALEEAARELSKLADIGPDGIIVQDLGVARLCRRHFPELNLHASTQLVAHNLEGVLALGELGFTRVVLARELSLAEIASISKRCGSIELECFIHGALCYSLSGLCLFGAMEKGRSGNRGKCPYCCRMAHPAPGAPRAEGNEHLFYPFSMKDLRLGEDARKLVEAGVASLKIEGRMKSALYVASVTRHYREILDGSKRTVANSDLETVFSRRTTELYFNGSDSPSPIDSDSLGHLGTPVGTVKRVTRDREGRCWLRFHTARALEVHDGLQFDSMADGRHLGLGIREMRQAISRTPVF